MFTNKREVVEYAYTHYHHRLLDFFKKRIPYNEAVDYCQMLYINLLNRNYDVNIEDFSKFVFTAALNLIRDRSRRRSTYMLHHTDSMDISHEAVDMTFYTCRSNASYKSFYTPDHLQTDELEHSIHTFENLLETVEYLKNNLPHKQFMSFVYMRFYEKSHTEIADILGVTVSAVEKYIMESIKLLKSMNTNLASI